MTSGKWSLQTKVGIEQNSASARAGFGVVVGMRFCFALLASFLALPLFAEDFQGSDHPLEYDHDPIKYSDTQPTDAITALQNKITSGEVKLGWDEKFGYLPAVLDALKVPKSSQTLVFSKTSLQRKHITPENPRALYFNDDVYIGYVPGAPVMEISAADPNLGGTFYFLELEKVRKPKFVRSADCLSCHGGQRSLGIPGHFVRSVPTNSEGELNTLEEVRDITQCTPVADRWAGWYVTGKSGPHRGNLIGEKDLQHFKEDPLAKANVSDLSKSFDESKHLAKGSDIVALMVLEHQAHMHNYIARLNIEARQMMAAYGHVRYMRSQVNAFLRYLLFTEESPLAVPVSGSAEFIKDFAAGAIRDSKGRSLRDLDMKTRMFKYPCSYLITNPAFDAMAAPIKEVILKKLHDILTGKETDEQFAKISPEDRAAILEILIETKKTLPDYWRNAPAAK